MKKATLLSLIIGSGIFLITSCAKEGCTDIDATNYYADAKKDDGSCQYEGNVVIWYGETASIGLVADGAVTLTFYVDGQIVGSTAANVYWTGSPDCGQNGSITVTKDLGNAKNLSYTYSVVDQTGWEYWSGVLNFTANTCTSQELGW